jgi:putative MATE family efflux protein
MNPEPLTRQSIGKTLIRLAVPAIFSNLFYMVFEIADMFWVGRLGGEAVAALSSASFFIWMLRALGLTIATGALALVSQKIGARPDTVPRTTLLRARQSTLFFSLMVTLPALLASRHIFTWMGLGGNLAAKASDYAAIFTLGLVFVFTMQSSEHLIRATGNTKIPMVVTGIALALNIVLDPLFMFTFGMGISGAALATLVAQAVGAVLMELALQRRCRGHEDSETPPTRGFNWRDMGPFSAIGAPIAFSSAMFSLIYLLLAAIIARFGEAPIAAIGIGHRIEAIPYFVSMGFAVAASTMVGQNLGAGQLDKARKSVITCLFISSGLMLLFSMLMFIFAEPLYGLFIADPAIIAHGREYIRIVALFEIFLGFELIFEGAFSGAGDTRGPMWIVLTGTLLRLPVAWLLAVHFGLGTQAIWWGISGSTFLKGIALAFLFARRSPSWRAGSDEKHKTKAQAEILEMSQLQGGIIP